MTIIDNKKEIKCLIEEIDCQNSINALRYKEPTCIDQDISNEKVIESVDEFEIQNYVDDHSSTDKLPLGNIIDAVPDGNCVVEEVDCRKSLISIGYHRSEEEKERIVDVNNGMHQHDSKSSVEAMKPKEDVSGKNVADATAAQLQIDYSKLIDISKFFSEFDINKFVSSSIIASVVDYTSDNKVADNQDEKEKEMSKNSNLLTKEESEDREEILINGEMDTSIVTNCEDELNRIEGVETIDNIENTEEVETNQRVESSNKIETGMNMESNSNVFQSSNFLKGEWAKKVLHTGKRHLENKIGFLSLLSVLGFAGIFTETKACLGFFVFLYFIRYFYLDQDDNLKSSILKASKVGFFTSIFISTLTVVLWLLIHKGLLFSLGLSIGMAVSVIAFIIIVEVCMKKHSK